MQIHDVGMTRNHFQAGDIARVRMVVLHATAGRAPGDYDWLRQGGSSAAPVSIHYYIDKKGTISRMVADKDIAWHAGTSTWVVDGRQIDFNQGCNPVSIGIELENLNDGADPYPQAQYDAALWLTRKLVNDYRIPRSQLVRHLDIAPQRKTDPRGFPWERFVAEVYTADSAAQPAPQPEATQKPTVPTRPTAGETLPPARQLRHLLVDLAYRAASTSCPQAWPLLQETISRETGMPVVAITPTVGHDAAPEAQARAVTLPGQSPLVVEAYGRDLFYAAPDKLAEPVRLSQTGPGLLRDVLLHALFRAVDPVNGFQPDWAFHQFYLEHMDELGVPIGPNFRLKAASSSGQVYTCQHFALDTLCSPEGQWRTIIRLSDLARGMYSSDPHEAWERELRTQLLNDLYQRRTGRNFDPSALFCQYAIAQKLGAPLGKAEYLTISGQQLVGMPFALDVIYCRVPGDGAWRNVAVNALPGILGDSQAASGPRVARLSELLRQGDNSPLVLGGGQSPHTNEPLLPAFSGMLLGSERREPVFVDLTAHVDAGLVRQSFPPDLVVIYPTSGPASADLLRVKRGHAVTWHYYLDRTGVISRLVDEQHIARPGGPRVRQRDQRSLAIAVEGGTVGMSAAQHAALIWLLGDSMKRLQLKRHQIVTVTADDTQEWTDGRREMATDGSQEKEEQQAKSGGLPLRLSA